MYFDDLLYYCSTIFDKHLCIKIFNIQNDKINVMFTKPPKFYKIMIKNSNNILYYDDGKNNVKMEYNTIPISMSNKKETSLKQISVMCNIYKLKKISSFIPDVCMYRRVYTIKDNNWYINLIIEKANNAKKVIPDYDNYDNIYIECNFRKNINELDILDINLIHSYIKQFAQISGGSYIDYKKTILNSISTISNIKCKYLTDLFTESTLVNRTFYFNKILQNIHKFQVYKIPNGINYNILIDGDNNKIFYITKNHVDSKEIDFSYKSGITVLSAVKYNNKFCIRSIIINENEYLTLSVNDINKYNKKYGELLNMDYATHSELTQINYKSNIKDIYKTMKSHELLEFTNINTPFYDNSLYQWIKQNNYITFLCKKCPEKYASNYNTNKKLETYILYLTCNKIQCSNTYLKPLDETKQLFSQDQINGFYFPIHFSPSINPNAYVFLSSIKDLGDEYISLTWDDNIKWSFISKSSKHDTMQFGDEFKYTELNSWNYYRNPMNFKDLVLDKDDIKTQMYFPFNEKNKTYEHVVKYNSFVKGLLISNKPTNYVIDMASGKGQDLYRYYNSNIKNVLMIEIDNDAIDVLIDRKYSTQNKNKVEIHVLNANLNDLYKSNIEKINNFTNGQTVDQIYCFFALHYLATTKLQINNIVMLISSILSKNGKFLYTSFDKKKVLNLLGKTGKWEIFDGSYRKYSIIKTGDDSIKLTLPLNPDEYYNETLIDDILLDNSFKKNGMVVETEGNFLDYIKDFSQKKTYLYKEFKPHDEIFVSLYKYKIYKKS